MSKTVSRRSFGAILVAGIALALATGEVVRSQTPPRPGQALVQSPVARGPDRKPVVINANELIHDREKMIVTARGNVIIFQGDRVVLADQVVFDQRANRVVATGNVAISEPGGHTVFANRAELTRDMKDGVMDQFRMLFPDSTKLAANGAIRIDGKRIEMSRVVFSPCRLCPENPTRAPLWQLKARHVTHDDTTKDISYRDAVMELYGVPIFYTPYISHPDPTVRRRTGFLTPTIGSDSRLGRTVSIPYFVEIGKDKDATITPLITTNQRVALFGQYRHRFPGGALITDGSITYVQRTDDFDTKLPGNELRGHLFGIMRYDINNTWRAGFDAGYTSDRTYLRRYNVYHGDTLRSTAFTEGFFGRDYAQVRLLHFRTLRVGEEQSTLPYVLPLAEYHAIGNPVGSWGRWHFDTSITALQRTSGTNSRRFSITGGWHIPYTDAAGWKLNVTANINADVYWIAGNETYSPTLGNFTGFQGRIYPQIKADWRYPFVRELGNVRQVIEPRVAIVATPPNLNTWRIPNEDSQDLDLDDGSLFDLNRFSGHDRIDDGVRVVYGMSTSVFGNRGGKAEAFLGQSWRLFGENEFNPNSGIRSDLSDVVGRIRVAPGDYLSVLYRFRFATKNLSSRRQDITVSGGVPAFRAHITYVDLSDAIGNGEFSARRQVRFTASSQITERWSVQGWAVVDLTSKTRALQSWSFSGVYRDECCTVTGSVTRTQDVLFDYRPTTRFLLTVNFKYLGEVRQGL